MSGKGCPKCAIKENADKCRLTQKEFVTKLKDVNPNVTICGEYVNSKTHIDYTCNLCGKKWSAQPSNLLCGYGCLECSLKIRGLHSRKTNEEFVAQLFELKPTIKPAERYNGAISKIKFACCVCHKEWYSTPDTMLHKASGCPFCSASYGEQAIGSYLDSHNILYVPQMKYNDLFGVGGNKLSYDFYLPLYNLLIEYQGQFHDGTVSFQTDEEYKIQKKHDELKMEYALSHKIDLLEIWYYNFKNINEILSKELSYNSITTEVS